MLEISTAGLHESGIGGNRVEGGRLEIRTRSRATRYFKLSIQGALISFGVLRSGNDSLS
jgi:hypothetical protein